MALLFTTLIVKRLHCLASANYKTSLTLSSFLAMRLTFLRLGWFCHAAAHILFGCLIGYIFLNPFFIEVHIFMSDFDNIRL